jgi:hypothetical protein
MPAIPPLSEHEIYPLDLSGSAQLFTANIPEECLTDMSEKGEQRVFLYFWLDRDRGCGASVDYAKAGSFRKTIGILPEELDLLKIQAKICMRDNQTSNYRTVTFATSSTPLEPLVKGEEVQCTMRDQFNDGNFARIKIKATNAHEFANYSGAALAASGAENRPLIRFKRSALWDIAEYNQALAGLSMQIQSNMQANSIKAPPGGSMFADGISRSALFLAFMLGTPAYTLTPWLQLGIRRDGGQGRAGRDHPAVLYALLPHERAGEEQQPLPARRDGGLQHVSAIAALGHDDAGGGHGAPGAEELSVPERPGDDV